MTAPDWYTSKCGSWLLCLYCADKISIFAVLKRWLLQKGETEAFVYICICVCVSTRGQQCRVVHGLGWIGSHKIDPWTTLLSGACGWSRYRWTKNGRPLTVNGLGVQQVLGRGSLILSRDDNGSHFLTRDPRDP